MTTKDKIVKDAAFYFAEIGEIPQSYTKLLDNYPKGKVDAVLKRTWNKYFKNWDTFIGQVKKQETELCALAQNPPQEQPVEEKQDPLEALRAGTIEK